MSWLDQGRQEHGLFGHGTAPKRLGSGDGRTDPRTALYESAAFDRRIIQVAHGAVGALPRKGRGWYEHSLHRGGLDQLRRAMPTWTRGALLDPATFHEVFFGRYDSPPASRLLQSAARETVTAHPRMGLGQPLHELADAVQTVGIYAWPAFLSRSAQRADEVLASDDPRIIRVGTTDLPAGVLGALGIIVLGAIIGRGSQTGEDRRSAVSPTPPGIVRQDTPESTQEPEKTGKNRDTNPDGLAQEMPPLPANPDELVAQGWKETSTPSAAAAGHRTFENPQTGEVIRFDKGRPGQPGFEGQDHYHRRNPNRTGKGDEYLDQNGNPVARGSTPSHLLPRSR